MARRIGRSAPGPYIRHLEMMWEEVSEREAYPFNLPVIRDLTQLKLHPSVTFLVGENGSGKSTLLEAMAVAYGLNPEGGSSNFQFSTRRSHSSLHTAIRFAKEPVRPSTSFFLRSECYFNLASDIEALDAATPITWWNPAIIDRYGKTSLHEQSHGESFFALFRYRFRNHGLYFLDEPEAAMSPKRQLEFLVLLNDFVEHGAQFVIATHSPLLMAYPQAWIYNFDHAPLEIIPYQETTHYQVSKKFIKHPQQAMAYLWSEEAR